MNSFTSKLIGSSISFVTSDWINRVLKNGGAMPSYNTIHSADIFVKGLVNNQLFPLIKTANIFAPDSLIACLTPLINSGSSSADPWVNGGTFTTSALSINGLLGNGSTQFLDTGFSCSRFATSASSGMTAYISTATNTSNGDMGIWFSSGNNFGAYIDFGGSSIWDCYLVIGGGGRISAANSAWSGYISFNRTNLASSAIYKANSGTAHTTVASSTTETNVGGFPSNTVWMLGQNPHYFSDRRFSFAAVHDGLTSAQSSLFFNQIHALRKNLGGGFI